MNDDPASLDNLRDIVTMEPVSWWPLAPGWYGAFAVALVLLLVLAIRRWRAWRARAYRRAARRIAVAAKDPGEIAAILKRTAMAATSREEVAPLYGSDWCDWLEERNPSGMPDTVRQTFEFGLFGGVDVKRERIEELRDFSLDWIDSHVISPDKGEKEGVEPC